MNEVKTFARAGEAAGAAVGTRVKTARKGAQKKARKGAARARQEVKRVRKGAGRTRKQLAAANRAGQLADRADHLRGDVADRWGTAQELLTGRAFEARRELAARIDPTPTRRRRWPLLLLILVVGGVAATVALARRPQPEEPTTFGPGGTGTRSGPAGHSASGPHSNGFVPAEHPSATTD